MSAAAPPPGTVTALVLAGQRGPDDPVARHSGQRWKALAPVAGRPMVERVLDALLAARSIDKIAVAAPTPDLLSEIEGLRPALESGRIVMLPTGAGPAGSVAAGWKQLGYPCPTLVTTADHALLTPALIDAFCARSLAQESDIDAALVPASAIRAAFPESRRTFLRFREESYSGANLFALKRPAAADAIAFWQSVEQDRKRPWRIARRVGPGTLLAYLLRRLTLEHAMGRLSRVAGAQARTVILPEAWAAVDVDKPEDLALAERILASRNAEA
ncbi:nucleotidyltransferase family protein [Aquibaculum arenosum]|uniref:Nucleotidyltransferase family protein n=1 Tax=Aquibaculum arenosum TaxID=3032591 RepID=A0ABT5YI87_9PROT|nr:nucleotidyltransferase family protein [Fodinicurvata sp. CAU 1616]MDF2094648.1 nucleotidyltransferase family protein [Fodinicurvata sp. CAU 1616]